VESNVLEIDVLGAEETSALLSRLDEEGVEVEGYVVVEPEYSSLTSSILKAFEKNRDAKRSSGIEDEIFTCLRDFNGEYSASDLSRIQEEGGSNIFMNLTATKVRAAQSWIRDILLSPNEDPFTIKPTPIPSLPEDLEAKLEKAFKEQNATITRTFQELKSYKDLADSPKEVLQRTHKASFLDKVMDTNPGIRAKITRILETGNFSVEDEEQAGGWQVPQGADPGDPLLNPLQQLHQTVYTIQNQLQMEQNRKAQEQRQMQFSEGLNGAKARFKEMTGGKEMTDEQAALVARDMREMGVLNGARFVPDLFWKEIQDAQNAKTLQKRSVKKNLPKVGASRRPAPSAKKRQAPREEVNDDLWAEHMGSDD